MDGIADPCINGGRQILDLLFLVQHTLAICSAYSCNFVKAIEVHFGKGCEGCSVWSVLRGTVPARTTHTHTHTHTHSHTHSHTRGLGPNVDRTPVVTAELIFVALLAFLYKNTPSL